MWSSVVDGQPLTFYLVGINNQNFVMADHQTGTWWQQVTGEAIQGPLVGSQLERMTFDEVSFGIWSKEQPRTRVLDIDPAHVDNYRIATKSTEEARGVGGRDDFPLFEGAEGDDEVAATQLVLGIELGGVAKAYPIESLVEQSPVLDSIAGRKIVIWVRDEGNSIRVFDRVLDGKELALLAPVDSEMLVDSGSGSEWDFSGEAISGSHEGRRLGRVDAIKDYWFDWKKYHPETRVFRAGYLPGTSTTGR